MRWFHPLLDRSIAVRAIAGTTLDSGVLAVTLDHFDTPAFVLTADARVVFANRTARAVFRRIPTFLAHCAEHRMSAMLPPGVRSTRLPLSGRSHFLVTIDGSTIEPDVAPAAVWATHWRLGPRMATAAALVMSGLSDKEIAIRLGLSLSTVRSYVQEIFRRAKVHNRVELLRAALDALGNAQGR